MTEIAAPTLCPECSSRILEYTEDLSKITTHWCENVYCKGRVREWMTFVADRKLLEIEGLGPELASFLVVKGYVCSLPDLFELSNQFRVIQSDRGPDALADNLKKKGFPVAQVLKMIETVERAKTASWDRWMAALGIPMIGVRLGAVIAKAELLQHNDMGRLPEVLRSVVHTTDREIEGIGFHKKAEILRYAEDAGFQEMCLRLYAAGVTPTPLAQPVTQEGAPLAGMAFVVTGEMYSIGSREFITGQLVKLGAVSKSGVTKKVTHLLVGEEPGPSKLKKAAELKIPTFGEDWLIETFAKHGVKTGTASLEVEWAD